MRRKVLTYAQAMLVARNGMKVRASRMNGRWGVTMIDGELEHVSNTGAHYKYIPTELDKADTWEIVK